MNAMTDNILLIDDDPDILTMLDTLLTAENYRVFRAGNGEEAMELMNTRPIGLAITDMTMPGINGLEVLRRIKRFDPNIEVVILTGNASFENAVKALKEDGAFDYLTKPLIQIDDLLITVKRALEKRKLRIENQKLFEELKKEVQERRKVDQKLLQSKTTLQSVFDGISEPLIMLNRKMRIKVLNRAAKEYAQASRFRDIVGRPCFRILAGRQEPCSHCNFKVAIESGKPMTFERQGLKDVSRIEEVVIYPMHDKDKGEGNAIIRISDITEQKKLEEHLIRAYRLSSLGQLSGGIAHEIRNPLASINLFTDILRDEDKYKRTAQEKELFGEIKESINRIEGIIKRVLDFARPPVQSPDEIDLNVLVKESIKFWSTRLRETNTELKLELTSGLIPVQGDVIGLQQVINNVVANAMEAMGNNGLIRILTSMGASSLSDAKEAVFLKVRDTGPGIKSEHQEDVFNPFFTTKATGTGLGLSISHQIIKRQGGAFSFESKPGEGTTFIIELPTAYQAFMEN